jgi:hypothetical protein
VCFFFFFFFKGILISILSVEREIQKQRALVVAATDTVINTVRGSRDFILVIFSRADDGHATFVVDFASNAVVKR